MCIVLLQKKNCKRVNARNLLVFYIFVTLLKTDRSVVGSHDVHRKASNGNQFLITNDEFKLKIRY